VGKPKNRSPKILCSLDFCSQFIKFNGVRELAPSGHRFFGHFLFIKKKKVTLARRTKNEEKNKYNQIVIFAIQITLNA